MQKNVKDYFILAFVLIVIIGNALLQLHWDYKENLSQQKALTRDIVRIVASHVQNTMRQADSILGLVGKEIQKNPKLGLEQNGAYWSTLQGYCKTLSGCSYIAVINPSGQITTVSTPPDSGNIDVSDRRFFQTVISKKKLFVGRALKSRARGNPIVFTITIPVLDHAGKIIALICAGMDTAYLTNFYGLMGFDMNPTITVLKKNGDFVARNPDIARHIGSNYSTGKLFTEQLPRSPSGTFISHSVFDGKNRLASYKSVEDLDLVVFAGVEVNKAMRLWEARAWRVANASTISLLIIFLALYAAFRLLTHSRQLRKLNMELDRISNQDGLTGIGNRRYFDIKLNSEWNACHFPKKALSILMIDIDHFKKFNDTYGHQAGDECLRNVASALQSALQRDSDLIARYGGEEFAAILHGDDAGAVKVAEQMRRSVQNLAIPHAGSSTNHVVTISVGVASDSSCKVSSPLELIRAADYALYAAKHNRNRVELFSQALTKHGELVDANAAT